MDKVGACLEREREVIIDYQWDSGCPSQGKYFVGQFADLRDGQILGSKLDDIRATITELSGEQRRRTPVRVTGVNERVQTAILQFLHSSDLSTTPILCFCLSRSQQPCKALRSCTCGLL